MKTSEVLDKVLKGKRVSEATKRHYEDALGSLAKCSDVWPESGVVINEWLGGLTGYADTTVRNWYNFVNSAGKYMDKISGKRSNGVSVMPNPCESADRPRVEKKRRRYLTPGEMVKVIKACRFEQDKVLVLTLIDSTCRIGELAGLRIRQVGDSWLDLKGKSGERRYRCDSAICGKLRELGADGGPIFKGRNGVEADVNSLKHRVRRVFKEAGLTGSKLGPHTLRHSGASLVAQETGSALAVKALLQHDKIDTSMEYIHDAEDVIQQRISPLRLVGEKAFAEASGSVAVKQIGMGEVDSEGKVTDVMVIGEPDRVVDMLDEQYREVADDAVVHSRLRADDIRLLRRVFIRDSRSGLAGADEGRCKLLYRRMISRVKEV